MLVTGFDRLFGVVPWPVAVRFVANGLLGESEQSICVNACQHAPSQTAARLFSTNVPDKTWLDIAHRYEHGSE
jgi:hypothetical protein